LYHAISLSPPPSNRTQSQSASPIAQSFNPHQLAAPYVDSVSSFGLGVIFLFLHIVFVDVGDEWKYYSNMRPGRGKKVKSADEGCGASLNHSRRSGTKNYLEGMQALSYPLRHFRKYLLYCNVLIPKHRVARWHRDSLAKD